MSNKARRRREALGFVANAITRAVEVYAWSGIADAQYVARLTDEMQRLQARIGRDTI